MSKYTTEVRFICEMYAGLSESAGGDSINDIIAKSRERIFNFSYPIYDESYKSVLETKILKHYYTKEIGFETAGLWQHWLDMRMNEIMPYYNQLYESCLIKYNPMYDVDVTTTSKKTTDYDETSSGKHSASNKYDETNGNVRTDNLQDTSEHNVNISSDSSGKTDTTGRVDNTGSEAHTDSTDTKVVDKYSDTPQGALNGVESGQYLTNARITESSSDNSGNSNSSGTETSSGTSTNSGSAHSTENGNSLDKHTGTQKNDGSKNSTGSESGESSGVKAFDNVDDYLEHVVGHRGGSTFQQLLKEYRETFLNIDAMIIEELDNLFMKIW